MAKEFVGKRWNGAFHPATQHDTEVFETLKVNQPYKVKVIQWSERSLQHHRLYMGGLVQLVKQYWKPRGGLIAKHEKQVLMDVCSFVERQGFSSEEMKDVFKMYLEDLKNLRSENIEASEPSTQDIHNWIKEEAGYFKWVQAPGGLKKELLSINFNALSQEEFEEFYKKAKDVAWNFILSRHFQSEQEMDNAIAQLQSM